MGEEESPISHPYHYHSYHSSPIKVVLGVLGVCIGCICVYWVLFVCALSVSCVWASILLLYRIDSQVKSYLPLISCIHPKYLPSSSPLLTTAQSDGSVLPT